MLSRGILSVALGMTVPCVSGAQTVSPDVHAKAASAEYVPTMTFDVASVRESPPANSYLVGGGFVSGSTTFRVTNFDIRNLLSVAYGIRWDQMVGVPNWRAMFNVEAKSDAAMDERMAKLDRPEAQLEQQHMLQALLADRFQLKTHWEMRSTQTYDLLVGKKGVKMAPGGSSPPTAEELKDWGDQGLPPIYQRGDGSPGHGYTFVAHKCTTAKIAEMLSGQLGHPVKDRTGLTGTYDFILQYQGALQSGRSADDQESVPALDLAIQNVLGLKLESAKGMDRFLVIDHIEKPSPN
ncbi:TIGR03435 family protein [Granulicella paludicola]|uniref:TIGR03435 family protein n=1 Tax=Granulicella paludicola TaxID=474951 RepID=UPI0021E04B0D|nr:TIGR03435 family protein [Granulicella paludicola]